MIGRELPFPAAVVPAAKMCPAEAMTAAVETAAVEATTVASAVTAFVLVHAIRYAGANSAVLGAAVGFLSWLGFTAMPSLGYVLYGSRRPKLSLIDNGYHLVGFVVMGAILGAWR